MRKIFLILLVLSANLCSSQTISFNSLKNEMLNKQIKTEKINLHITEVNKEKEIGTELFFTGIFFQASGILYSVAHKDNKNFGYGIAIFGKSIQIFGGSMWLHSFRHKKQSKL